ncbi:PREDICTED: cirhin-like [Priapulus caudatus]|uniref:Cirhin-like n=1 Tax=Priapulus caudatus TaxID=37621 RepID=A0ABM1ETV1_PRICU|nr:PREDICTED: cirhin-like [Priapulus caudatus]
MSDFRVHRVRFFQYTPQAIQVIAFDDSEKKLAVGRADNSIEIWNCKENIFHHEKTIHGDSGRSVESLAWLRGRLFSAGLHGDLTEYDLSRLRPKTTSLASGGAIWCMQLNCAKDCLAVLISSL